MNLEQPFSKEIREMKYFLHGEESIEDMFWQIAKTISAAEKNKKLREKWKHIFFKWMNERKFIPGGRILANARPNSKLRNYGNCYVIGIEDSLESIYKALQEDAFISAAGGGVGFNISALRPKDALISRGGESSGPLSFADVFDVSAKVIRNGGGRRSAHILIMDISHPDIEEFITYKKGDKNNKLTSFNISVGISQEFMDALENDEDWNLKFEGKVYKTVKAKDLFDKIAEHAFYYNEPGLLFYPSVDYRNYGWYTKEIGKIRAVNPCLVGDSIIDVQMQGKKEKIRMKDLIDLLKQEEEVFAKSYSSEGKVEYKKITWGDKTQKNSKLVRITDTETGKSLKCTPDHKILTKNRGYVEASKLEKDDLLVW